MDKFALNFVRKSAFRIRNILLQFKQAQNKFKQIYI